MNITTCKCLHETDLACFREDPTRLDPNFVACLGCLPISNKGRLIQDLAIATAKTVPGKTTYGDLFSPAWCDANGFVRGRVANGNETLFVRDQTAYVCTLRQTPEGTFFVFHNPADPHSTTATLYELPPGTDTREVGAVMETIYVVRQVGKRRCVTFPDSPQVWHDRVVHPDDRFVLLGNERLADDMRRHGSLFNRLVNGLATPNESLGVRCVVRLA